MSSPRPDPKRKAHGTRRTACSNRRLCRLSRDSDSDSDSGALKRQRQWQTTQPISSRNRRHLSTSQQQSIASRRRRCRVHNLSWKDQSTFIHRRAAWHEYRLTHQRNEAMLCSTNQQAVRHPLLSDAPDLPNIQNTTHTTRVNPTSRTRA